ncbi:ankyrin repeat-containing domain protein [Mycena polygramma]|nr:ankyrin repeat-containing domain protein [Mycena polygramma]
MADIVGLVASILQLVDTVAKTRDYIQDFRNAPHDQQKLLKEIQSLDPLLGVVDPLIRGGRAGLLKNLETPLEQMEKVLSRLTKKLDQQGIQKFRSRLTWSLWGKKDVEDGLKTIERFKSSLNAWLGVDNSSSTHDILSAISNVIQEQLFNQRELVKSLESSRQAQQDYHEQTVSLFTKTAEELGRYFNDLSSSIREVGESQEHHQRAVDRDQIIKWYSPLNMLPRHAAIYKNREPGTGLWLLEHPLFQEWKLGTGKMLWCQGMPGAGKTVLASLITNTLRVEAESQDIGVGVIYLQHSKETDVPDPSTLLAALWRQLVFRKLVSPALEHLYSMHHEPETRPTIEEDDAILRSIIVEYSRVFILVDGLDEYPQEPRDTLLRYLGALGSSVNLLLTSRPHIIIGHIISSYEMVEIRATEHDIGIYLDSKIAQSKRLSNHIKASLVLQQSLKPTVVKRSDGMFLLVKLHFDSLTKTCTVKDARIALENMADNLDRAYSVVVDRINQQDPGDRKLAWRTLSWITHAKRPLRCSELQGALAVEPGATNLDHDNLPDRDIVLSICAGLVVFNEKDEICFIHYTTAEYFKLAFPGAQSDIAMTCITYLSFRFEGISPALRKPMFLFTYNPFLHYAVKYCLSHAKGPPESEIKPALLSFLSNCSLWRTLWTWKYGGKPLPSDRLRLAVMFHLEETVQNMIITADLGALLQEAAVNGATKVVRLLLNNGVNVRAPGLQRRDCTSPDAAVILSLLNKDALNADRDQCHGLHITKQGEKILKLCLESGTGIDADGGQALEAASSNGNTEVVKLLIDGGADINANDGEALRIASAKGDAEIVKSLIEAGADVDRHGGRALGAASHDGSAEVAKLLIEAGADVDANSGEALREASKKWDTEVIKLLVEGGADINANDGEVLRIASEKGDAEIVKLLIEVGADVDANNGQSLQAASRTGSAEVVKLLMEAGINSKDIGPALYAAFARNGNAEVIKLLIEGHADVDASETGNAEIVQLLIEGNADTALNSGLCAASRSGSIALVKLFIDAGADVDANNGKALSLASRKNNKDIVNLLIEAGANINAPLCSLRDINGQLSAAAKSGDAEVVKMLIEAGANVNAYYGAALWVAIGKGNTEVVKLLLESGAHIHGQALRAASEGGNAQVVKLFLEAGADVNDSGTALRVASENGNREIAKLLIEAGVEVDAGDGLALWTASRVGNTEVVKLLIEAGADVNANSAIALRAAARVGNTEIVKLLIEAGADVNANGGYPLRAASQHGYAEIIELLVEAGADVNAPRAHLFALYAALRGQRVRQLKRIKASS